MGAVTFWLRRGDRLALRADRTPLEATSGKVAQALVRRLSHGSAWRDLARGAVAGAVVQAALETAFRPVYTTTVDWSRAVLFVGFLAPAAPAFWATCAATGRARSRWFPLEAVLAALTVAAAPRWFVRMSMLPVFVLALILLFVGAYRVGRRSTIAAAAFGAVMYARSASVICALY
jgi:hypothetical protein